MKKEACPSFLILLRLDDECLVVDDDGCVVDDGCLDVGDDGLVLLHVASFL